MCDQTVPNGSHYVIIRVRCVTKLYVKGHVISVSFGGLVCDQTVPKGSRFISIGR